MTHLSMYSRLMLKLMILQYKRFGRWMNYNPPGAMTSKGWRLFKEEFKQKAPVRHWVKHDFTYGVMYPIKWKYEVIADWIRYRCLHKYHVVNTGLAPGYASIEQQLLHSSFNLLKDFVEVEVAWHSLCMSRDPRDLPWYKRTRIYGYLHPYRDAKLGIAHFEWAARLDDPLLPVSQQSAAQAHAARETLALYRWWVDVRPNRIDIEYPEYSKQGLDSSLAALDEDFDTSKPDFVSHRKAMDDQTNLEEQWSEEDEAMSIRLIKIRSSLWT